MENSKIKKCLADLGEKLRLCTAPAISEEQIEWVIGSISRLLNREGFICLDVEDISAVTADAKKIYVGMGYGKGAHKAEDAARSALADADCGMAAKVTGAILLIDGPENLELKDIEKSASLIQSTLPDGSNTIFSAGLDRSLDNVMRVTVILAEK